MSGSMKHEFSADKFRVDGLELHVERAPRWEGKMVRLVAIMRVPDRDTGNPTEILLSKMMDLELWDGNSESRRWSVHQLFRETLMHELDECLLVDGVRVFDPHKDEP